MPNIPAIYDSKDSASESAAGVGNPPATPSTAEASDVPGQNLGLTASGSTPAAAPQPSTPGSMPQETLTPPERALKAESWGTKLYHGILNALGGGGDVSYSRDPKTGKMTATPVATGPGTQWKRII